MADEDTSTTEVPTNEPAPAFDPGIITRAVNDALRPVAGTIRAIDGRLQAIEQGARQPEQTSGSGRMAPNDLMPGLDEHITERVREANKEMLSPLLQPLLDDKIVDMVDRQKGRFDSEFGDGAWDKFVKADVDQIIETLPANQKISARHIALVVDGLKGRYFDQLSKAKTETNSARDRDSAPPMMGNSRQRGTGPTLSSDETEFIARLSSATGEKIDPKEWMVERELGNTAAEWREYFKGKEKH